MAERSTESPDTCVIVLCGLPGAGKSTIATALARELDDAEVVATDAIGGRGARYPRLRRRVAELAGRRRFVVLDGTFYSREHRATVRALGHPVLLVYLECPLEVCLRRNRAREAEIPERGLRAIQGRFEAPEADEGPLVIHSDRVTPEAATQRILRAIGRHPPTAGRNIDAEGGA